MRASSASAFVAIGLVCGAICACGPSKDPNVYSPLEMVRSPRPARGTVQVRQAEPLTSVTGKASSGTPDTDPEALAALEKSLLSPSALVGLSGRPSRVLELALESTTRGHVDGLVPDGPARSVALGEGEHARLPLSLPVGSCWTIVAQGGLGVVEVDLFLRAKIEEDMRILAQDLTRGPSAVLGGRAGCFTAERALEAELVVLLRRGTGDLVVRVYRR